MPKISVCLPVYNGEKFLAQAIDSVLQQTEPDFELLISDDASTDRSAAIAAEYAAKDSRIRWWPNSENQGLFANYNACIRKATGTFIKLFAQDDVLAPTILQVQCGALAPHPTIKLVATAKHWIDSNGKVLQTIRPFAESRIVEGRDVIRYNLLQLGNWVGEPSTVMFRREDAGDGFDTRFYHYGDIEYWFRLVEKGDYLYINEPLCSFRRHEGSSTTSNLAGLYFALDMLLLGKKYRHYSQDLGENEQHYIRRALEVAARHLDHLVADDGLTVEDVGAINKGNAKQREEQLRAFKELSFHALRYVTKLAVDNHSLRCTVTDLNEMVTDVRQNAVWNITRPLRKLSGKQVSGIDPAEPKVSSGIPCDPEIYHAVEF